ncbi:hypothetical protein ERU66_06045 [Escherichia coli]|nr:hypothetical protein [Escherichia coli]EKY5144960.1 hypothetical protein [Escherichia coli]
MFKQKKTKPLIGAAKPGKASLEIWQRPVSTWSESEIQEYREAWLDAHAEYCHLSEAQDFRDNLRFFVEDGELIIERVAEPAGLFLAHDDDPVFGLDLRPYRKQGLPLPEEYRIGYRRNKGAWPMGEPRN